QNIVGEPENQLLKLESLSGEPRILPLETRCVAAILELAIFLSGFINGPCFVASGSGFNASSSIGPKTHQRVCGEAETRNAHIPSYMWGVNHHFGRRAIIVRVTETFPMLVDDSTEVQRVRYAWVDILQILRGYLMLDKSRNLVHLRWLLKLIDFRTIGELNWGFIVFSILYREMCRATQPNKIKIGGCLSLLKSWAQFRFPFLRNRVDYL
ncbi:hypothetical protein Gohar_004822, partial [Gossypium harknessii]|nr:hypothetical protein [Gossypium harknessii]